MIYSRRYRDWNLQAILGVPIKDEKSRSRLIGESLPQLLNDPTTGGMSCDIEMQDTPPTVMDDKEAVEHTERDGRDGEEVHGRDGFSMITQKGEPTLGQFGIFRCSADPMGDCSFGHVEAKHQELTVNTRCAPGRIFRHQLEDQIPNFLGNSSSANDPAGSQQSRGLSAIALCLWMATPYAVEITDGHNFGEAQGLQKADPRRLELTRLL